MGDHSSSPSPQKRNRRVRETPSPMRYSSPDITKKGSSKYDFVKLKVWLSDRHYYVLSRFLMSRVLTAIKVDYAHAIRIALDLKKELVDKELLSVKQEVLEVHLFDLLKKFGYGEETVKLYKMFSSFHHQRIPLVILVGGTACIGKSSLATQLAERLNLSTVLKTGIINELISNILKDNQNGRSHEPVKFSKFTTREEVIKKFEVECDLVKKGLDSELRKCFKEGKSIIVEGIHVNPGLYSEMVLESRRRSESFVEEGEPATPIEDSLPKTTKVKTIVVSFLLTLEDEKAHREIVSGWIRSNPASYFQNHGTTEQERIDNCLSNFRAIQSHLQENCIEFQVVQANLDSINDTLDYMHSTVLNYMQGIYDQSIAHPQEK